MLLYLPSTTRIPISVNIIMAPLLSITHLSAGDSNARQRIIASLTKLARFVESQHQDILRFGITIPRIENDESAIFIIEEFASSEALNKHLGSKALADHFAIFSEAALLSAPPKVLTYKTFTSYTRRSVLSHPDPYILIAAWDYQKNTRTPALSGWQDYNDGCKRDESGTLMQVLATDENDEERVGGVMAFDSEQYFWDVHVAGKHTTKNKGKYGNIRVKTDLKYYKLVAGFLGRESRESRL